MGILLIVFLLGAMPDDPPPARGSSPSERFQALRRQHEDLLREDREAAKSAKTPEQRAARTDLLQSRMSNLSERAFQLARTRPDDVVAIEALTWIVKNQKAGSILGRALNALGRDHIEDPKLVDTCREAGHLPPSAFEPAEGFLLKAYEKSPHHDVRGVAGFNLADRLRERSELVRRMDEQVGEVDQMQKLFNFTPESLGRFRARSADDLSKEAIAIYERLCSDYFEVPTRFKGVTIGKLAEARLFQIRNLAVGGTVPEIDANDFEGKPLKLSDQKGKVVVLVFAGTWSVPSRRIYPLHRAMVERLKDRPFTLLGFNAEQDPKALRKAIDTQQITWRCWREDGPFSPTLLRWGIHRYPTIFIIDAQGKIRYRDPNENSIDLLVDGLLKEMESSKNP